ncbi:RNA-directed DNA polymerase from transposon x-element, partial [Paraphaeosphaeria sporulosa]
AASNTYSSTEYTTSSGESSAPRRPQTQCAQRAHRSAPQAKDPRILLTVPAHERLAQSSPYAIRKAICEATGLSLSAIPNASKTQTGWAITPTDAHTRALLMEQDTRERMIRSVEGSGAELPQRWVNYAVPGVPSSYRSLLGADVPITQDIIEEEVTTQTGHIPVNCRPSRHGADDTGCTTWIISFTHQVRPFRLLGASDSSREIVKKRAITRHDPGCQGYCNPARAGQEDCLAVPRRINKQVVCPTRREMITLRRAGQKAFEHIHTPPTEATSAAIAPIVQVLETETAPRSSPLPLANAGAPSNPNKRRNLVPEATRRTSTRPQRTTAVTRNLNVVTLSAQSLNPQDYAASSSSDHEDTSMSDNNNSRSAPCHTAALEHAFQEDIDIICIQEPATWPGTRTSNHPSYNLHPPTTGWDDPAEWETLRPRVLIYTRKGSRLQTHTTDAPQDRDRQWLIVNGISILNIYRQPQTTPVLEYVLGLAPTTRSLVGGDFNTKHDTFEPGVPTSQGGAELAAWATSSGMDFIGEPGVATHRAGHVLDLTFSNIPFAKTEVRPDMHCGSDHSTLVTTLLGRGQQGPDQFRLRVTAAQLPQFARLVKMGAPQLPPPTSARQPHEVDRCASSLTKLLRDALHTVGKPKREGRKPAPWWTEECASKRKAHLASRGPTGPQTQETRDFLAAVRKAKRAYWQHTIDGAKDDASLFKIISWYKLEPTRREPPLLFEGLITCVLPRLLYGTEAWYGGRTKPPQVLRQAREKEVSTRLGWHVAAIDKVLTLAVRGVIPAYRTTPNATLYRDAGIPTAATALEECRARFAMRLQTLDEAHPLTQRATLQTVNRGRRAGRLQRPRTKVQRTAQIFPPVPRPLLCPPHYSPECRTNPTGNVNKKTAAEAFTQWQSALPSRAITIFSDGSEQWVEGTKHVTYGYAAYQDGIIIGQGNGSLNPRSHVFDAEAVGAWRGLKHVLRTPRNRVERIWLCIDSTSVIWGLRGDPAPSSQWAFLRCQEAIAIMDIGVRWAPGHSGIEGNELADELADNAAKEPRPPTGKAMDPTITGLRSDRRNFVRQTHRDWWRTCTPKLSTWYNQWCLTYDPTREPPELALDRPILAKVLSIRTRHGDYASYHRKFRHEDAATACACGADTSPDHIVHCPRTVRLFKYWPSRPAYPPSDTREGLNYLRSLSASELALLLTLGTNPNIPPARGRGNGGCRQNHLAMGTLPGTRPSPRQRSFDL